MLELSDRDAAKMWIIKVQLGRRNINKYQRTRLHLMRDSLYKAQAKARQISGLMKGDEKPVVLDQVQRETTDETKTDFRIAKEAGVSPDTIYKVRVIDSEAEPEVKEQLRQGKTERPTRRSSRPDVPEANFGNTHPRCEV